MLSPRTATYDRLESGSGKYGAQRGPMKTWKKVAIAAVVLVVLVYIVKPTTITTGTRWTSGAEQAPVPIAHPPSSGHQNVPDHGHNPHGGSGHTDPELNRPPPSSSSKHPTTFEDDPDPSSTTYCSVSHDKIAPIVQWALMIDAGSTGSRIHVYKFNNCQTSPSFEYEVFKMRIGGLSKYKGDPAGAAASLDELMAEAVRVVPEKLQKCTPVAVKATAGLRLLGPSESDAILKAVHARLKERYPFTVEDVVIMDGKDEGVYAWITANYLLDTIRNPAQDVAKTPYAVLDLGGASTQIVFEPKFQKPNEALEEGDHKFDLTFLGKEYVLYQHSYLGYGLMEARMRINQLVDFMSVFQGKIKHDGEEEVFSNPCIAKGMKKIVELKDPKNGAKREVVMDGEQIGSFEACNRVIELALAKDSVCKMKPCSFNGVYQPSLLDTFAGGKVLLLSYFYDRIEPILTGSALASSSSSTDQLRPPSGLPNKNLRVPISSIATFARYVCEGPASWASTLKPSPELQKELEGRPDHCLDLTFMHALLRLGYEFPADMEVELGKKVDDTELGWCLGATIGMVSGGKLECRI